MLSRLSQLRLFLHNSPVDLIETYLATAVQPRVEGAFELGQDEMLPVAEDDEYSAGYNWDAVRRDGLWPSLQMAPDYCRYAFEQTPSLECAVHHSLDRAFAGWQGIMWPLAVTRQKRGDWDYPGDFRVGQVWADDEAKGGQVRRHFPPSL